jgi:hypothetical protein
MGVAEVRGIERLYLNDFNHMQQQWQDDGSVIVTFYRSTDEQAVSMHIDDLYGPKEEILLELAVPMGPPAHILARQSAAIDARVENG